MILLKKSMDVLLKKVNLPSLYVERIDRSGGLTQLCTPCGTPIMFIPEIRVTHNKLTIEEREYIFEAISKFIMENVKDINKSLEIRLNPVELKEYDGYLISVNTSHNYKVQERMLKSVTVVVDNEGTESTATFKLIYKKGGEILISTNGYPEQDMWKAMGELDEMKKIGMECFKIATKMQEDEKLITKFTTCKI